MSWKIIYRVKNPNDEDSRRALKKARVAEKKFGYSIVRWVNQEVIVYVTKSKKEWDSAKLNNDFGGVF